MYLVSCLKQGLKIEGVVPHRVGPGFSLEYFCPKLKSLAAPLYPNMGQVPSQLGTISSPCDRAISRIINKEDMFVSNNINETFPRREISQVSGSL